MTKLEQAFNEFLKMRKLIKKPCTPYAQELAYKCLERLAPGNDDMKVKILDQSTFHTWQGLFQLKRDTQSIPDRAYDQQKKQERKEMDKTVLDVGKIVDPKEVKEFTTMTDKLKKKMDINRALE